MLRLEQSRELPLPARVDTLAAGGASCFRDALFHGRSAKPTVRAGRAVSAGVDSE